MSYYSPASHTTTNSLQGSFFNVPKTAILGGSTVLFADWKEDPDFSLFSGLIFVTFTGSGKLNRLQIGKPAKFPPRSMRLSSYRGREGEDTGNEVVLSLSLWTQFGINGGVNETSDLYLMRTSKE